jgi:hypothetical protein
MAATSQGIGNQRTATQNGAGRRRGFVAGSTEARPGIMTTEFWLTVISAATVVIAAYVSEVFSINTAWQLFTGLIAAYVISRGLAKAGSREGPFVASLGDDDR